MIELFAFSSLALLIGVRHGFDLDHVAAITDMVGAEQQKNRQLLLGIMYAVGHGLVVLVIGLLALYIGIGLSEKTLLILESLVGATLIVLGGFILYSMFREKKSYVYKSRISLIAQFFASLIKRKETTNHKFSSVHIGIIGAFTIGIIHGIGVETPTQITILSSAIGLDKPVLALIQLVLFVLGILLSTILITFLASWGFLKAQLKRKLYLLLGSVTGIYSIGLGYMILTHS